MYLITISKLHTNKPRISRVAALLIHFFSDHISASCHARLDVVIWPSWNFKCV